MNPTITHQIDKKADAGQPPKSRRPNALRNAQVLPPFHVDLTLSPEVIDDIHVPAHASGRVMTTGRADPAAPGDKPGSQRH